MHMINSGIFLSCALKISGWSRRFVCFLLPGIWKSSYSKAVLTSTKVNSSGLFCKEPFKCQGMRGFTPKPHQQDSQPKTRRITRASICMRKKTIGDFMIPNQIGLHLSVTIFAQALCNSSSDLMDVQDSYPIFQDSHG